MNSSVGRYGAGPGERKLSRNTKPLVYLIASHRIFLFNDGRQVSRLSCCFCTWQTWGAQGRASTRGSRAGTAAGIFQFRSEGGRTCNNLQDWKMQLSITATEIEKPHLNWSQQLTDLPLWQLLCIYQSGKTLIIPQQSMSSKRQSLCSFPMPITLSCRHCCIQKHILHSSCSWWNHSPTWSTASSPLRKETTAELCSISWLPAAPLHLQPLIPTQVKQGDVLSHLSQVWARLCMGLAALQDELSTSDSEDVKTNPTANIIQSSVIHVLLRAILSFLLLLALPLTISL